MPIKNNKKTNKSNSAIGCLFIFVIDTINNQKQPKISIIDRQTHKYLNKEIIEMSQLSTIKNIH